MVWENPVLLVGFRVTRTEMFAGKATVMSSYSSNSNITAEKHTAGVLYDGNVHLSALYTLTLGKIDKTLLVHPLAFACLSCLEVQVMCDALVRLICI